MNMKKILLAGIAVGALASTSANAVQPYSALVSNIALAIDTVSGNQTSRYTIANGSTPGGAPVSTSNAMIALNTSAADTGEQNRVMFKVTGPGFLTVNNQYEISFTLSGTGNPIFAPYGGALTVPNVFLFNTAGSVPTGAVCAASTPTITTGGGYGSTVIRARFDITGTGCDATNSVTRFGIDAPIGMTALGTAVITGNITTPLIGSGGNYDSGPSAINLVQTVDAFDLGVSANPSTAVSLAGFGAGSQLPTLWAAAPAVSGFNGFTSYVAAQTGLIDQFIGSVKVSYVTTASVGAATSIYSNLAATAVPTLAPVISVKALTSPVFAAQKFTGVTAGAATFVLPVASVNVDSTNTVASGTGTAVAYPGLSVANIQPIVNANNNVSVTTNQAYQATVSGAPSTNALAASATVSGNLETTTVQGFRIDAPWFGGSRASTPSLVRLSNSGAAATGSVILTLSNAITNTGESLTATTCSFSAGIPAGQEFLINTDRATTCFGNFVRGDLSISVQGNVGSLSAKMRVLSSNGSVSEQTLGNLATATAVN